MLKFVNLKWFKKIALLGACVAGFSVSSVPNGVVFSNDVASSPAVVCGEGQNEEGNDAAPLPFFGLGDNNNHSIIFDMNCFNEENKKKFTEVCEEIGKGFEDWFNDIKEKLEGMSKNSDLAEKYSDCLNSLFTKYVFRKSSDCVIEFSEKLQDFNNNYGNYTKEKFEEKLVELGDKSQLKDFLSKLCDNLDNFKKAVEGLDSSGEIVSLVPFGELISKFEGFSGNIREVINSLDESDLEYSKLVEDVKSKIDFAAIKDVYKQCTSCFSRNLDEDFFESLKSFLSNLSFSYQQLLNVQDKNQQGALSSALNFDMSVKLKLDDNTDLYAFIIPLNLPDLVAGLKDMLKTPLSSNLYDKREGHDVRVEFSDSTTGETRYSVPVSYFNNPFKDKNIKISEDEVFKKFSQQIINNSPITKAIGDISAVNAIVDQVIKMYDVLLNSQFSVACAFVVDDGKFFDQESVRVKFYDGQDPIKLSDGTDSFELKHSYIKMPEGAVNQVVKAMRGVMSTLSGQSALKSAQ